MTQGEDRQRITALEMKGDHLAGNDDTAYKKVVLELMTENFSHDATTRAGTLELVQENGVTVVCDLVLFSEWQSKLPGLLNG